MFKLQLNMNEKNPLLGLMLTLVFILLRPREGQPLAWITEPGGLDVGLEWVPLTPSPVLPVINSVSPGPSLPPTACFQKCPSGEDWTRNFHYGVVEIAGRRVSSGTFT